MRRGSLRAVLLGVWGCFGLLTLTVTPAQTIPCSPNNWTKISDLSPTGLPTDFCSYPYLPWRVRLPEHPANIDSAATTYFQQYYAANSGSAFPFPSGENYISTSAMIPINSNMGTGNHPFYRASMSDPLVTFPCGAATYGCSDARGVPVGQYPPITYQGSVSFHIPPYARTSGEVCGDSDQHGGILQPDGTVIDLHGCQPPNRDWQDGDVLTEAYCQTQVNCGGPGGLAITHITDSLGINGGNINAGDAMIALPATYQEVVVNGEINHMLHLFVGCVQDVMGRWPATTAAPCTGGVVGLPQGVHVFLDLSRAQIDQMTIDHPDWIPPFLKVFAYAAHEHGFVALDTGGGRPYITQPMIEDNLPFLHAHRAQTGSDQDCSPNGCSAWRDWMVANGGTWGGNGQWNIPMGLDWKNLAPYLKVVDPCYVHGTCSDSVPEGGPAGPLTYYIAPNGSNSNSCVAARNSTTAKATFQDVSPTAPGVLSCLMSGDKVIVQNGVYAQWIEDGIPSGQAGAPTVVQAAAPGGATLRPSTLPPTRALVSIGANTPGGKSFMTVDGLVLDGSLLPQGARMQGVAVTGGSHDLTLTNLDIHHIPNNAQTCTAGQASSGVVTSGAERAIVLQNSHIHHIGYDASATNVCSVCLAHSGGTSIVAGVEVEQCQGAAMAPVDVSQPPGSSNTITQSFFHDSGGPVTLGCGMQNLQFTDNILSQIGRYGVAPQTGTLVLGGTCSSQTSSGHLLYNNTIVHGTGPCMQVGVASGPSAGPANSVTLRNNLCWQNDSDALSVVGGSTGTTMDHNLVTGSTTPLYGDPLFVTSSPVTAPDFQLRLGPPASPGIDTGVNITLSGFTTDYGGNPRQQGTSQDVGAWEAAGSAMLTTPIAWWRFDEGSGTTAADSTNHGHDLTLSTGVAWGPAKVGNSSLHCQGNAGRGTTSVLTGLSAYTWMAWLQSPQVPGSSTISAPFINGSAGGDQFGFSWDHITASARQAGFHHQSAGAYDAVQIPGNPLPPNQWVHVAVSFETPALTLRLYINGQPSTVVSNSAALRAPAGLFEVCGFENGNQPWSGLIDELKVWNRALSAAEIQSEFRQAGGGRRVSHRVTAN